MRARRLWAQASIHAVLGAVALLTAIPVLIIWSMAFKSNQEIFTNLLGLPLHPNLNMLRFVWVEGQFSRYFLNSLAVAVPTVLLVIALASLTAYGLGFLRLPAANIVFYIFLLGFMIPVQALIVPLFYNLARLGLLNTIPGLVLVESAVGLPFAIFLMRGFLRSLPYELIETARIDGAAELRILLSIVLPLSTPALFTLATLQFMWSWNEFLLALIVLQEQDIQTVTLGLLRLQGGKYTLNYSAIAAGVLLTSLPIIIVFYIFQRRFIEGLTAGAVKG